MLNLFNHYSAPILAALLFAGGLSLVLRQGGETRHWLILAGAIIILATLWLVLRPVARPAETPLAGQSLLLELQSPYCLGCVAMKPLVDRLERELRGKLVVRRVDIQSDEGRRLASTYGIELTPTFILFDRTGREEWRSAGQLDGARVRASVQESAKQVP